MTDETKVAANRWWLWFALGIGWAVVFAWESLAAPGTNRFWAFLEGSMSGGLITQAFYELRHGPRLAAGKRA